MGIPRWLFLFNAHSRKEEGGCFAHTNRMSRTVALNLTNLTNELKDVTNWHSLGIQLGIPARILNEIEENYPRNCAKCKSKMFEYWLANCTDKSWKVLARAVENIDRRNLANKLKKNVEPPEVETVPVTDGRQSPSQHSFATTSTMSQAVTSDTRLSSDDVPYLVEILSPSVASKWNEIGTALRFNPSELHNISSKLSLLSNAPLSYFQELLSQWVQWPNDAHPNGIPTIGGLESALKSRLVGYGATAEKLKIEFQRLKTQAVREESRLQSLHSSAANVGTDAHDGRNQSSNNNLGFERRDLHPLPPEIRLRGTAQSAARVPTKENVSNTTRPRTNSLCSKPLFVIAVISVLILITAAAVYAVVNAPEDNDVSVTKTGKLEGKQETPQPVTTEQGLTLDGRPTVPQLTHLNLPVEKYGSDKSINIFEEIGRDWLKFGTLLLDDVNGNKVDSIESRNRGNFEAINRDIVREWLKEGVGKQPHTWKTLIEVLMDIKHRRLVKKIKDVLDSS